MGSLRYRPEIDGLRAVAIIPVILSHVGFQWIAGGFIGVDVFFVISGYLITSIILREHDKGMFRFSNFWLRRIRRIFPALVVMLIVTSIVGYFMLFSAEVNDLGEHGISAILSFANITMWQLGGGYWGVNAHHSLLLHTWSLSVEEQFYFIYPLFLTLLLRFARKWTLPAILAVAICSFILYLYGSQYHMSATFYLLPMRAWELASGCIVATLTWNQDLKISKSLSFLLSLIGFAGIISSYLFISGGNGIKRCLAIPVIGSVLIIACGENKRSIVNVVLSSYPLVFIGKISYSLYIWHWPVVIMAGQMSLLQNFSYYPCAK